MVSLGVEKNLNLVKWSSGGCLEVEQWTVNSTLSISVGSNPARRQKISVVIQILREALSLIMFEN